MTIKELNQLQKDLNHSRKVNDELIILDVDKVQNLLDMLKHSQEQIEQWRELWDDQRKGLVNE